MECPKNESDGSHRKVSQDSQITYEEENLQETRDKSSLALIQCFRSLFDSH